MATRRCAGFYGEAHRRGLRVVGDLTTNHTGVHHEWFTAARADADAEEASYYRFLHHPEEYETWLGVDTLPRLDHRSAALAARLHDGPGSVVARWLREGLDGWRIDVANMTGRSGQVDLALDVARRLRATATAERADPWVLAEHCFGRRRRPARRRLALRSWTTPGSPDPSGRGWSTTTRCRLSPTSSSASPSASPA